MIHAGAALALAALLLAASRLHGKATESVDRIEGQSK
jgi:hypothetical protein